jgi:hypothetical protein
VQNNDTLTPIGALNAATSVTVKGVAVLHLYPTRLELELEHQIYLQLLLVGLRMFILVIDKKTQYFVFFI